MKFERLFTFNETFSIFESQLEYRTKQMKSYKLDEAEDLLIGKKGTQERDEYEFELKLKLIGDMIKTARKN